VFYTRIDQHKHSSVFTTLTATGDEVTQVTLPNHRGLLREYFTQFPGPHQAVVEATGRGPPSRVGPVRGPAGQPSKGCRVRRPSRKHVRRVCRNVTADGRRSGSPPPWSGYTPV